jgi:pimeloyl-ACP methyl ester carboxylesterase
MKCYGILMSFLAVAIALSGIADAATPASVPGPAGTWQGVLKTPDRSVRRLLEIRCMAKRACRAIIYSIDETDVPIDVKSVAIQNRSVRLEIDMNSPEWGQFRRTYSAALSLDGNHLRGTWSAPGGPALPLNFDRIAPNKVWPHPAPATRFVTVAPGVKLETLDWGGNGRPVVLLAGLGNSGHIFYHFAQQLRAHYHVYAISRRGYGRSTTPPPTTENYGAAVLGSDVDTVIHALSLQRPVLIGHSIAGQELTDVAMTHPHDIAGVVYLDAGYGYAAYDSTRGDLSVDSAVVIRKLSQAALADPEREKQLVDELLTTDLPHLQQVLQHTQEQFKAVPTPAPGAQQPLPPPEAAGTAIINGLQRYSAPIPVPALAIFASPHAPLDMYSDQKANAATNDEFQAETLEQIETFKRINPSAKVIEIPHANHYVFLSNEADVLAAVQAFINTLPH